MKSTLVNCACWMLLLLMVACVVIHVGAADFQIADEENDPPELPMVFMAV